MNGLLFGATVHHSELVFDPSEWGAVELNTIGWTERGVIGSPTDDGSYLITVDTNSKRGKSIVVTQGGFDEYRAAVWDRVGAVTDFEVYAIIKLDALPNSIGGGGLTWVNSGHDGYDATFADPGTDEVRISQFTDGFLDGQLISGDQNVSLNTSSRFHLMWKRVDASDVFSIKCWEEGDAEPSYSNALADSTYTSARELGIQTVEQKQFRVDFLGIGVGAGVTAPRLSG